MPTYTHYAITKETGVDILNAIEKASIEALREQGHEALHAYTCFATPETITQMPDEVLWAGIDHQAHIAVSFVDY